MNCTPEPVNRVFMITALLCTAHTLASMGAAFCFGYLPDAAAPYRLFTVGYLILAATSHVMLLIYFWQQAKYTRQLRENLQEALSRFVGGFLPMCANCKRVRSDPDADPKVQENWTQVDTYLLNKLNANVSHGVCPECLKAILGE